MNPLKSTTTTFALLLVLLLGPNCHGQADDFDTALANVRAALAGRKLPEVKEALQRAKQLARSVEQTTEYNRVELIAQYVEEFWGSVADGIKRLRGLEELEINGKRVAVVDALPNLVILRLEGRNLRYTLANMPPRVALTIAELVLPKDKPNNQVFFGCFLLMDAKGDRKLAREMLTTAQRGGVDVSLILPEFGAAAAGPPVEIPAMNITVRRLLNPRGWSLELAQGEKRIRRPLTRIAKQEKDGTLIVPFPADAVGPRLLYGRALVSDFGLRMIVKDTPANATFGFYLNSGYHQVKLPRGTCKIEFARQRGSLKCLVNEAEAELQSSDGAASQGSGRIGVAAPGGNSLHVAWFELRGR